MKIWVTIMVIIILGLNGFFIHAHIQHNDEVVGRTYEGRVYLVEQEYEEFKKFLADNPEVKIHNMETLSSPNALIDMKLYAPVSIEVSYDLKVTEHYKSEIEDVWLAVILVTFLGLAITATGASLFQPEKK